MHCPIRYDNITKTKKTKCEKHCLALSSLKPEKKLYFDFESVTQTELSYENRDVSCKSDAVMVFIYKPVLPALLAVSAPHQDWFHC